MGPTLTDVVGEAYAKFRDPKVREQVDGWYAQGWSFVQMLEGLGLDPDPELRSLIEGLSKDEVAIISKVMREEIARAGAGSSEMPVDCDIERGPIPSKVSVAEESQRGRNVAKIRRA